MKNIDVQKLDFEKMNGLIPAIVQDNQTLTVLMLGFMNKEAFKKTLKDKKVTFYSRTRKKIWQKGETSGNYLKVVSISLDCDNDCILIKANPAGPTCHTGKYSCFEDNQKNNLAFVEDLFELIKNRKKYLPKGSYTSSLFVEGLTKILEKVEEESTEVINAAKNESKQRLIEESCDLIYHMFVLLAKKNIEIDEIADELKKRNKRVEKN